MLGRDEVDSDSGSFALDLTGQDVHRRIADEGGHEPICRLFVDRSGRTALEKATPVKHGDAIAHEERLVLIVRHEDPGRLELTVKLHRFLSQRRAEGQVETRERLIEEKHARTPHDRSTDRHALPFPSREGSGPPGQK